MRAEDILPDGVDQAEYDGVTVRKGSIAAFLANAVVLTDANATAEARAAAERDMITAMPVLHAVGLFDVLAPRNPLVRAIVDAHKP
ncbi:hypothetical protein [Bradyrhizobium prioriisuperbiae]|uniref:hypothetical protein n=1 Tax=Bradyrhizobium prioriisuperbiae TaxID=2854389 RepID=UPI0028E2D7A4|nr:hypothetical protein [Bradyrhizobium prioritasuperba]